MTAVESNGAKSRRDTTEVTGGGDVLCSHQGALVNTARFFKTFLVSCWFKKNRS